MGWGWLHNAAAAARCRRCRQAGPACQPPKGVGRCETPLDHRGECVLTYFQQPTGMLQLCSAASNTALGAAAERATRSQS